MIITNPLAISIAAMMKIAVSSGVIIQLLRMARLTWTIIAGCASEVALCRWTSSFGRHDQRLSVHIACK